MKAVRLLGAAALFCVAGLVHGQQQGKFVWEEFGDRVESARTVTALGSDLLGDSVSLANGELSFDVTDVSIPGNGSLPVEVSRSYKVFNRKEYFSDKAFADWDISLPRISSIHVTDWTSQVPGKRCSVSSVYEARPQGTGLFSANTFWQGNHISIPGLGEEEMLVAGSQTPTPSSGGPYPWVTAGLTRIGCLASIQNGAGEGFLAITPDGTRYWFNRMAQYHEPALTGEHGAFQPRRLNALYATRVEDRFGNVVTYTYDNAWNAPVRLTRIEGDDGRALTLSYDGSGHVTSVSDGNRTWRYAYTGNAQERRLVTVTLPDDTQWQIDFAEFTGAEFEYPVPSLGEIVRSCLQNPHIVGTYTGAITHPSGASGEFTVQIKEHNRSNVPVSCENFSQPHNDPNTNINRWVVSYHAFSLVSKVLTGPGIAPMEWSYDYGSDRSVYYYPGASPGNPICPVGVYCDEVPCLSDDCAGTSRTRIVGPDGAATRHVFGNSHRYNEGKLLWTETISPAGVLLRRENHVYDLDQDRTAPYPARFGISPRLNFDGFSSEYHRPSIARMIEQQGHEFFRENQVFDGFARPLTVMKYSDVTGSPTRTEQTRYHDNLSKWVLGQPSRLTVNGLVAFDTAYDANVQPTVLKEFGRTVQTLAYNADGTVKSVKDGNNRITTFSSWKRGIPQTVGYPATPDSPSGASTSAVVNNLGWITRITDENGFQSNYQYDTMGRLSRISYPAGDAVTWNATTLGLTRATGSAYGLPAGHWQHTVATGNGRKVTYLDALWRPVLVREYDTGNVSGTQRFTRQDFDHAGRTVFASYPGPSGTSTTGQWTEYDALSRVRSVSQDSELGVLTTITDYMTNADGYYTRVTSPKGEQTRTWFQAFDEPGYDSPTMIRHPEDVQTDIIRDIFGKPTAIARRNSTGSQALTRRYVYDAHQQLCKTVEPETGATIMAYDNAGNLAWSKSGATQTGTSTCNTADIPLAQRTVRSYDARNRVLSLVFPDNLGNTSYSYTPDGLLASITVDNGGPDIVSTAYTYNRRRLLTGEAIAAGSHHWAIGYGYNANGHLDALVLPGGETVSHAPNALGQPTRAGSYATGARYFPSGALKQFTYGNGIVRTFTQNARGLPERSRDAHGSTAVFDESQDYDSHGNVAAISDGLPGARGDRTMEYDGLDRLTGTVSPMFGTAAYTYDVFDNLTRVRVSAGPKARDHRYTYDAANRLSLVANTSGGATVASLGYDAQGNLSSRNGQGYQFDHGNRLRSADGLEHYIYDGHGRRVKATRQGGGSIYSVYGQDGVLRYQRDERRGETVQYIHLNGSLVARLKAPIAIATPTLTAPGYSATGSYTVTWSAAPLASKYQLRERLNSGSWTTIHDAAATSKALNGKTAGSWGYQVRACTAVGCGSWSPVATTTVELAPTAMPTLTAPSTSTTGDYTLSWTTVATATGYQLEERTAGGSWGVVHDDAGTSKALSGRGTGTWEYRVRGCNGAGCSSYSAIRTTQVTLPPSAIPALTVPASNTTGGYTVSWTSVAAATSYQLHERLGTGSWTTLHDAAGTSKAVGGKTTGSWSYRVRACSIDCGAWSAERTVAVILLPAGAPTLTVPATNNSGGYTVTWTSVTHASKYQLQERLGTGSWNTVHDASARSKAVSDKAAGAWNYRVRACNADGCADWSATGTTQVTLPPSSAPTLNLPSVGLNGAYSISWGTVATATKYQLQERQGSGSWATIHDGAGTSKAISSKAAGNWSYRGRACNAGGCGPWSGTATVNVIYPPATAPAVTVPATNTSGGYSVTWTTVSGATSYQLQERLNSGSWSTIHNAGGTSKAVSGKTTGTWNYRGRACNDAGCGGWSTVRSTAVTRPPTSAPTLTAPATNTSGAYTVSWTAVTHATRYQLQERLGTGSWSTVHDAAGSSKAISGKATGAWSYRSRACNAAGCGSWSAQRSVEVTRAPTGSPTVTASTPTGTGAFTVSWGSVSGAASYDLQERTGSGSWTRIQQGTARSRKITGKGPGTYQYRARGCNGTGCGPYSSAVSVTLSLPATPTGLSVSGGDFFCEIGWSASTGATRYELQRGGLEIYRGAQSSAHLTSACVANQAHQVRACNGVGCSAWSAPVFWTPPGGGGPIQSIPETGGDE